MNDSLASSTKSALLITSSLRKTARVAFGALLLAAASVGCGAATISEEPTKPVAAEQTEAVEKAARNVHAGMAGVLTEAAYKLDLTPQQKQTVDAIKADLQAKAAPMKEARTQLAAALADGVSKGTIDTQALAAPKANLTRAAEAFKPTLQDAVNRLHAALTPEQRTKLVDLLQQRGKEHKGGKHEQGGGMRGKMKQMAAELELTPDQIQTIKSNVRAAHKDHDGDKTAAEAHHGDRGAMKGAKREGMRAHMQKLGDAFKAEAFDARALDIGKELPAKAGHHAEKAARFLSIVTPTLTAPQRAKLASMIQKHGANMAKAAAADDGE